MFEKGNQHAGIVTKQLHKTCPTKTCAQLFGHRGELRLRSKASDLNSGANVSYKLLLLVVLMLLLLFRFKVIRIFLFLI